MEVKQWMFLPTAFIKLRDFTDKNIMIAGFVNFCNFANHPSQGLAQDWATALRFVPHVFWFSGVTVVSEVLREILLPITQNIDGKSFGTTECGVQMRLAVQTE